MWLVRWALLPVVISIALVVAACSSDTASPTASSGAVTGDYETPKGQHVELLGGNDDAVVLVDWAFSRFSAAGIPEPIVRQVDFAAGDPECDGLGGWAVTTDSYSEIVICLEIDRICRHVDELVLTVAGKFCILHELSHAWLAQYLSASSQQHFMTETGATAWRDPDLAPVEVGVEQAAETLAWGLLGESRELLGHGFPPCDQLQARFTILTGVAPLSDCSRLDQ